MIRNRDVRKKLNDKINLKFRHKKVSFEKHYKNGLTIFFSRVSEYMWLTQMQTTVLAFFLVNVFKTLFSFPPISQIRLLKPICVCSMAEIEETHRHAIIFN